MLLAEVSMQNTYMPLKDTDMIYPTKLFDKATACNSAIPLRRRRVTQLVFALFLGGASAAAQAAAQPQNCSSFLEKFRTVIGQQVGPKNCRFIETPVAFEGRDYVRLDVGLDGNVDGYVAETGNYHEYLTNSPDLAFPQAGNTSPRHLAVATYEAAKGAAMTILLPKDRAAWNNKMWVTAHGRGRSIKEGNLKPWDKNLDTSAPLEGLNKYDRLLMSKGYALVKTHRSSTEKVGEIQTLLDDGRVVDWASFNDTSRYIMDFARVAQNITKRRLGAEPRRTYFYGHSAGARIGHALNYTPGLNRRADGRAFFDGILADDAAAGSWLPYHMEGGKDVLFASAKDKQAFVPQLDVVHQNYNNIAPRFDESSGTLMTKSYLMNKRTNAKLILDKGLGARHRSYEIRQISHQGGESFFGDKASQNLPLAVMMDKFFDMLDAWADKGQAPPPSRSDWAVIGQVTPQGQIRYPGLSFPEVACPRGVYYPSPTSTSGVTAFTPFSGQGIEPLDKNEQFVDLNRNGVWDMVESMPQAWQRLGLLQAGEQLTKEKYVGCVARAADDLRREGFFSPQSASAYVEKARAEDLNITASPN